mmetsp:Transcript_74300/g.145140  ORF Transcript_74300/g.145140 Transcript_74300/m.145140 type:complete len:146 (-) Transcript_74300:158-595(-)
MTAPVVKEPTQMLTPQMGGIVTNTGFGDGDMSMAFLLPSKYKSVDDCPIPQDPRIKLISHDETTIAALAFSGRVTEEIVRHRLSQLLKAVEQDELIQTQETKAQAPKWQVAQYNPPFTIPFLRRNEIWLFLEDVTEEKLSKLRKA